MSTRDHRVAEAEVRPPPPPEWTLRTQDNAYTCVVPGGSVHGPGHQEPPSGMQGPTCLADVNEAPAPPECCGEAGHCSG